jgi:mono/diheme cytochrome c family protein
MLGDSLCRVMLCRVMALGVLAVLPLASTGAQAADDQIARGKYLATIGICGSCHTPSLAGGRKIGNQISANITPDASGIGSWSEQQIVEALRDGKRPDGSDVRPPMGVFFYRDLSDTDAHAIAAYLRQVPAVPTSFQRAPVAGPPPKFGPTVTSVPDTPRADKLAYGRYLAVTVSHCMQCHTPRAGGGLPDLERMGAGGNGYTGADGRTALSANITPGNAGGIATWTDAQVKQAITKGVRPDGSKLVPVMDFDLYEQMTPDDLDALVGFLRTLKPVPAT